MRLISVLSVKIPVIPIFVMPHAETKSMYRLKRRGKIMAIMFAAILVTMWFFPPFGPFLDDGPFHGSSAAEINGRPPDQTMLIWGGNTLESYDSTDDSISAIVQLRRTDGSVQWAIHANGFNTGDARSVRFSRNNRGIAR
jgi:hypothetical protein